MVLKIYESLFPKLKIGGYIAFAVFLMHPLLLISRFTIMHFEYASIFFLLLAWYFFIRFCQSAVLTNTAALRSVVFSQPTWLLWTIVFYIVATTFKEGTLMLMPALIGYLLLHVYFMVPRKPGGFFQAMVCHKENGKIIFLLLAVFGSMVSYYSMALVDVQYLSVRYSTWLEKCRMLIMFGKIFFGMTNEPLHPTAMYRPLWGIHLLPAGDLAVLFTATLLAPLVVWRTFWRGASPSVMARQSMLFLGFSIAIFLVLPIAWGHAMPWHLALPLVFLSLIIGYVFESVLMERFGQGRLTRWIGYGLAVLLGLSTLLVNQVNYNYMLKYHLMFDYVLDRNAVKHPPRLPHPITPETVIVVEDSIIPTSDYARGDSVYPYANIGWSDPHFIYKHTGAYDYPYVYGGNLFRWAYLQPQLKEQIYPFHIENMAAIPSDELIYNWLAHLPDIICFGYDYSGHWHDKTIAFKHYLMQEQARRNLSVKHYHAQLAQRLTGTKLLTLRVPIPDSMVCRYLCDKHPSCAGVVYQSNKVRQDPRSICEFYRAIDAKTVACVNCTSFTKELG